MWLFLGLLVSGSYFFYGVVFVGEGLWWGFVSLGIEGGLMVLIRGSGYGVGIRGEEGERERERGWEWYLFCWEIVWFWFILGLICGEGLGVILFVMFGVFGL